MWAVFYKQHLVVLFWYFRKKYRGFVNQWKASLKRVAFFLLFSLILRLRSGFEVQSDKGAKLHSKPLLLKALYLSPIKHPGCYDLLFTKNIQYHVLSEEMKQDLNNYGVQLDHIHVITPAINTEFFKATVASRKANEPLQLITVARLHWKKGIIYTLEALSHLRRDSIDFKYTIIGDGEEIERIKFAIYQLDLQDHVILAGKCSQEEVRRRLESSDIYLQYSIQEGFCNAALEAQSMGLMTIVSNAEGLTENVQHMRSGWVVPKRQPKQLAQKIVEVMKLPDSEKDDIRHFAMKRVKDEFNLRKQNREFKQFYLSVD